MSTSDGKDLKDKWIDLPHVTFIKDAPALKNMTGVAALEKTIEAIRLGAGYRQTATFFGASIDAGFQNALITGPQGTGKTTVAKILAFEMHTAGIVPRHGKIILVDAMHLVGSYTGQSEEKLKNLLQLARDCVIIIDEIDALLDISSFGLSLLNTLNVHMGNAVNAPVIIATCYGSRKEELLHINKGLEGRFRHMLHMPDYDIDTLTDMFTDKVTRAGLHMDDMARALVRGLLTQVKKAKGTMFANAREVQNIFDATLDAHAARLHREGVNIMPFQGGNQ